VANENWNEPGRYGAMPGGWRGTGDGGVHGEGPSVSWQSLRDESTGELIRDFVTEAQNLAREEIRLAKSELRQEAKVAGAASGAIGVGAAIAYAGFLALTACLIALVALVIPVWASALIFGVCGMLLGGVIAMAGVKKLKNMNPKPEQTTQTLKEDREWLSGTMRDVRSKRRVHT
jgi:hypothetical protein